MQVGMHMHDADLAEAFRSYVERRLRFALARFGTRVGQIAVHLGTDGRAEKHCRIGAEVLPFGHVDVEEHDADLFVAVDRATGRVGRLFGRELERARQSRTRRESVRTAA